VLSEALQTVDETLPNGKLRKTLLPDGVFRETLQAMDEALPNGML
jgi:hypothetical protein